MIKGLTKLERIGDKVYHLHFQSAPLLNRTFLRFQEHYESSEFKGKIFTLNEFKDWYKKSRGAKHFSYYTDWTGCNIPNSVFKPFLSGHFTDLTDNERSLLAMFKNIKGRFYVIGTCDDADVDEVKLSVSHELVHALFYLNAQYRNKVIKCVKRHDSKLDQVKEVLTNWGYDSDVLVDEINAYLATDPGHLAHAGVLMVPLHNLIKDLTRLHDEYRREILYS